MLAILRRFDFAAVFGVLFTLAAWLRYISGPTIGCICFSDIPIIGPALIVHAGSDANFVLDFTTQKTISAVITSLDLFLLRRRLSRVST